MEDQALVFFLGKMKPWCRARVRAVNMDVVGLVDIRLRDMGLRGVGSPVWVAAWSPSLAE